ncbi:MAG: sugar transferase [Symploca sp. SIO2B6]|nr:sugar transferase [Symploca sp. SIO2B6]
MTLSTILLKTPTLFQVPTSSFSPAFVEHCSLKWEQKSLIVSALNSRKTTNANSGEGVPALRNKTWLRDCLKRSPIKKIYLDPKIDESLLKAWANIGHETGKKVYLSVPPITKLPQAKQPQIWLTKRLADWLAAALLLIILSPLMLVLAMLIRLNSNGPIFFQQWRVGYQGQFFRIIKFRSMQLNAEAQHHQVMGNQIGLHKLKHDPRITNVGQWLRKYSLDELPQLFNVLLGQMSLVGPRPWAIYDAIRIRPELQKRLHALPGITGRWQVEMRSQELDISIVNHRDLSYLEAWSISEDLKFLLLTIPQVFKGISAY